MRPLKHCLKNKKNLLRNRFLISFIFLFSVMMTISCQQKNQIDEKSLFKESIILNESSNSSESPSNGIVAPNTPTSKAVRITWDANKEKSVNSKGGGYKVYYSQIKNNDPEKSLFVDVPYYSGALAPTSVRISNLNQGTYYFIVQAYSALNSGSKSLSSTEISVEVP